MFLTMQYKIDLKYFSGWGDAEWTESIGTMDKPLRFETIDEAQAALEEFLADVKQAVAAGNMDVEETQSDYRVVVVKD